MSRREQIEELCSTAIRVGSERVFTYRGYTKFHPLVRAELNALWARERLLEDVAIEHRVWADNKGWPSPTLAALTAYDSEPG